MFKDITITREDLYKMFLDPSAELLIITVNEENDITKQFKQQLLKSQGILINYNNVKIMLDNNIKGNNSGVIMEIENKGRFISQEFIKQAIRYTQQISDCVPDHYNFCITEVKYLRGKYFPITWNERIKVHISLIINGLVVKNDIVLGKLTSALTEAKLKHWDYELSDQFEFPDDWEEYTDLDTCKNYKDDAFLDGI